MAKMYILVFKVTMEKSNPDITLKTTCFAVLKLFRSGLDIYQQVAEEAATLLKSLNTSAVLRRLYTNTLYQI